MKGVIFNILEDFTDENLGEETWFEALKESGHEEEIFVGTNTYPDSILLEILTKILSLKSLTADFALKAFGEYLFGVLAKKYADVLIQFKSSREILEGLDSIIHVEVRKLISESQPPQFITVKNEDDLLELEYKSERELCQLAEGLLIALQKSNQGEFEFSHTECKHRGDSSCIFRFKFKS